MSTDGLYCRREVEAVARALRGAMPGLVNPEAWPRETLARAAIDEVRRRRENSSGR